MSSIRDLIHGDGRLDTALRALALTLFLAVAVALVWTTLAVRRDAAALEPAFDDEPNTPSLKKELQP
jgi:hypothetical protein